MKRFLARHSPLVILAVLCVVLAIASPDFRSPANLQSLAQRTCVVGILAMGQIMVILTAGIDLSVGSVAALGGVIGGLAMTSWGFSVPVAVVLGSMTGLACGLVNGLMVAKGRIPPFIATLGMMMIARGLALVIAGAKPIYGLPDAFFYLGGGKGWWIPVVITLVIVGLVSATLAFTRFGRCLYAVGGNLKGARLSGINVDGVRMAAYTLSGLCAGFAGMVHAARITIADPAAAEMYELDSIAACVIGGTSLMGGEGAAPAVLAGALIMNVLVNFCNLNNIEVYWQRVIVGALIIALVFYDNYRKRRAGLLKE